VDPAERRARNEAAFLAIAAAAEDALSVTERGPFLCECGRSDCSAVVRLLPSEYGYVLASPRWFVIAPGHESVDVVENHGAWVIVERRAATELH
jgi:hypothetical protein